MFYKKTKKDSQKKKQAKVVKSTDSLKNPEILEVNLVKDQLLVFFDWNKYIFTALLVFIVAGLFIFEVFLGLDYWEKRESKRADLIEAEIAVIKKDISALNASSKDALSYKDKAEVFSDLLDNHIHWTRFFSWLESNTLNTVKYEGFEGDVSGAYTLAASAPTYAEASWQTKIMADSPVVNSVIVDNVVTEKEEILDENSEVIDETSEVFFDINLDLKTDIFKK